MLKEIKISPLEGEKKFLNELYEFRNFREGDNLKYSCPVQHETVIEPSPAFVILTKVRKRLLPLTKREGSDSVIISNFFDTNHSQLTTHNSLISDTVFSRFTSHFSHKNKVAFTLAEVLITLGIIGVVAAMTLPSLIANYKNKVLLNQAKNSYSIISNAMIQLKSQNGYDSYGDIFSQSKPEDEIIQELSKSLKTAKICKQHQGGCWNWKTKYEKKKLEDGKAIYRDFRNSASAVLTDGSVITLSNFNRNGDCNWVNSYYKRDQNGNIVKDEKGNNIVINDADARCGQIIIDTNGAKGPNQFGADTWDFDIFPQKVSAQWFSFLYDDKLKYENYQEGEE